MTENGGYEPIALSCNRFNESWSVGIIPQGAAQLPNSTPNAVIAVEEDTLAPHSGRNLIARDNLILVLNEENQHLEGNAFKLQNLFAAAQPPGAGVKLKVFTEVDRSLYWYWSRRHGTTRGRGRILHHIANKNVSTSPAGV
jgi:hypothetical protein